MEVIFRDGSTVLTYSNRTGSAIPIIPNIPMEVMLHIPDTPECDTPYMSFHLQQADDPAGPWEVLISTASWSFHRNPAKCPPYILIPHTYEALIEPTKAYMRDVYGFPATPPHSSGYLSLVATYEVMPDIVYDFLMEVKARNEAAVDAAQAERDLHFARRQAAQDRRNMHQGRRQLYDNFLSDEIEQYELLTGGE